MLRIIFITLILIESVNLSEVTYYEILGITKQASSQDIRQAYKKLAIKYHPDKISDEADHEIFLKITEAYETLKDSQKRRQYDLYGMYPSYTKKYDYHSQAEYNSLYYNGLYHNDLFVDTVNGANFATYLTEGFHFINFYSPFCPPCQNLVDHWKKLAEIYKGVVKVGAVNCKHHNSFCYNNMRIGSYPSLLFYPNGKNGHYVYYRGDRTLEALDQFIMTYLRQYIFVPTISKLRGNEKAMAYVLGSTRIDRDVLTRIAYRLKGLVTLAIVDDDGLRSKLTNDEDTTIVFKHWDNKKEIKGTEEKEIQQDIVDNLPKILIIDPTKLKEIRNQLRNGYNTPWVLYFSSKNEDRLLLHQMTVSFPNMHFGEIDCDKWSQLCLSLQAETTPAWAVLKQGGGFQRASENSDVKAFLQTAPKAQCLHTLSASELQKILDGDVGAWVLLVAPYQTSWEEIEDAFTQTSLHFIDSGNLHFGIMSCTSNTDKYCSLVATDDPVILVQNGTKRHVYNRRGVDERQLLEFIDLIRDNVATELNEDGVLQVLDASSREHNWLVAHLPAHCGRLCDDLAYQIKLTAKKLQPLDFIQVAIHKCVHFAGFCANVRSPTLRLYPFASKHHYTTNLQHLAEAPYILEWALGYIDDSVEKLNWHKFARSVISEDLNPSSEKRPWLVYFHSPRCYRCYEMYADFAIAGILLNNGVHLGKVNCITDRNVCQHEQITSYPSLKLYLSRNKRQISSHVISIPVKDYASLINDITPHLKRYEESLLGLDSIRINQGVHIKHDEF